MNICALFSILRGLVDLMSIAVFVRIIFKSHPKANYNFFQKNQSKVPDNRVTKIDLKFILIKGWKKRHSWKRADKIKICQYYQTWIFPPLLCLLAVAIFQSEGRSEITSKKRQNLYLWE